MILSSWLATVFCRLKESSVRGRGRKSRRPLSKSPILVESLEQRTLPTAPAITPVTVTFTANSQIFPYAANSIPNGTDVTPVVVTDVDAPPNGYSAGNLVITAGNTDVDGNGVPAFRVQVINGVDHIVVNDSRDLYIQSGVTTFNLTLVATDNSAAASAATVITINLISPFDTRPVIPQYVATDRYNYGAIDGLPDGLVNVLQVNENSFNGALVGTVTAVDPDFNPLTYVFTGTVPGFNVNTPAFAIDPFTGKIRVTDPSFLDYEARRNGSGVGNLGEGGLLGFPDVTFAVHVRATDTQGLGSHTQQPGDGVTDSIVYIRLRDVGETPPNVANSTKSLSVNENSPVNLSVGFFQLISGTDNFYIPQGTFTRIARPGLDPTEGQQTHSFAIIGGNTNDAFSIDYTTGEIKVKNQVLNYEALNDYSLQIAVTDENSAAVALGAVDNVQPLTTVATLHIKLNDINETTSIPGSQQFSIPENTVNGTVVGTVVANDPDTQKPNGQAVLKYSIISGNSVTVGGVNYSNIFAIDPNTGTISVNNTTGLPQNVALNFENQPIFNLTVQVIDRGDLGTSANNTIAIKLVNINETPPSFSDSSFTIAENRPLGDLVGQVTAAVGEIGNSIVSYQILAGNTNNAFAIDNSGRITVNNPAMINFETNPQYTLTIKATDNGSPALFATAKTTITITNLNEQIVMLDQSFRVNENTPNGTIIGQIVTTDPDNVVTQTQGTGFTINGGNTGGAFAIDGQGRIIVVNSAALNFETTPFFSIVTTVTDTGVPSTSAAATMTIALDNVNDAPFIGTQVFTVNEHSLATTVVGTVQASDEDLPAQKLTFAITAGNTGGAFSINPTTGAITVNDPGLIDYLTTPTFSLTVEVTDSGTPALSSSATVTINLLDVQDPQISDQNVTIPENTANNAVVATVVATHGIAPYTYSILSGNVNNAFTIDSVTGVITVKNSSALDYETTKLFALKVLVTDSQSTPLGDTATVTINLSNVNEAPALVSLETTALNYIEKATTPVTSTIVATDPDSLNAQGAVIQLTTNYTNGQDTLVFTPIPQTNITGLWDATTGTMTLSGIDNLTNYRNAIRAVAYKNLSSNPSGLARTVTFTITDDGGLPSPTVSRQINVTPVNDPPLLASPTSILNYTEGSGALPINPLTTVTDPDNTTLVSGTVTLTNFQSGEDILGFVANPATMGNITVQSNSGGVLQLKSAGGTATLAQWQAAFAAVTYTNSSQNPTTTDRTVAFTANDGSAANNVSNSLTTTIALTAVNNPPVLSNPSSVGYLENSGSILINSGIGVADPDTTVFPSGVVTITNFVVGEDQISFTNDGVTMGDIAILSNINGQLALYSPGGTATAAQWQSAFASVTYLNPSKNPTGGARTVTFSLSDGSLNSNLLVSTIDVNPVNDPPVLSGIESTPLPYVENTAPNFSTNNTMPISGGIQASDPDSLLTSATVQITGNYVAGQDFLVFSNTATIKGTYDQATGTLTLTGSDTVAKYTAALRSVQYFNRSDLPSTLTRTVSYTVTDDGGLAGTPKLSSNVVSRDISVTAVNDPPVLKNADTTPLAYTEDAPAVAILPNVSVTDADSNNLISATIRITGNYNAGGSQDTLSFVNTAKISGSWDPVAGVLTLSGNDSLSNYRTALRQVMFSNRLDGLTAPTRTVSYTVTDDTGVSGNTVTRDITIATHANGAALSAIETTAKFYKANDPSTPPTPITSSLVVADPDSTNQTSAQVRISNNYIPGQDQLIIDGAVLTANKVNAAWNPSTGILTLTGLATMANYQNALRAVTYINTSATPNTATRTISYQTFDDTPGTALASNTVSRDLTISTANIVPTLAINSATAIQYTEKDPATVIAPNLTIVDSDSPNMNGATIKITGNYQFPQDQLLFTNTPKIQGSWNGSTGTLTLTGLDTLANYQAALRSIKYLNTSNSPSGLTRTVSIVVSDGLATSNTGTRNINVQPVNDPPLVLTNAPGPLPYAANMGPVTVAPGLTVTDPDSDFATSAQVAISFNYQRPQDVLSFVNTAKIKGSFDPATGILTLTGTDSFSNYRTALQSVTYTFNGVPINSTKTISFSVSDGNSFSPVASRVIQFSSAAPVVKTNSSAPLAYSPSLGAIQLAPALTVTDPDSDYLVAATVQITGNYQSGVDTLLFFDTPRIKGAFDGATGKLTLSGVDTVSNYRAALRSVSYQILGAATAQTKTVSFVATDGIAFSAVAKQDINVTP